MSHQKWMKLHASVGVITNAIVAARVTGSELGDTPWSREVADSPCMPGLVERTAANFNVEQVSGDKAYLANKNLQAIEAVGAKPFIPFKINSQADGCDAWQRMHAVFTLEKETFLRNYHKRSNVETAFYMIKKKFGQSLRSRLEPAQVNELLCKVICHNISVLVHSIHELGIEPNFWLPKVRIATETAK